MQSLSSSVIQETEQTRFHKHDLKQVFDVFVNTGKKIRNSPLQFDSNGEFRICFTTCNIKLIFFHKFK